MRRETLFLILLNGRNSVVGLVEAFLLFSLLKGMGRAMQERKRVTYREAGGKHLGGDGRHVFEGNDVGGGLPNDSIFHLTALYCSSFLLMWAAVKTYVLKLNNCWDPYWVGHGPND